MTEKIKKLLKKHSYTVNFFLLMVAATAAAFCFRSSAGILAMTPLAFIICAAASFLNIETKIKAVAFAVTVFTFNTMEQSNMKVTLIFTALILLASVLFSMGADRLKKKKKSAFVILPASGAICIALSFVFVGNPITALGEKSDLDDYISRTYSEIGTDRFGNFEFSNVSYNYSDRTYFINAVSDKYPTESRNIVIENGFISDGFESLLEEKATEAAVLELTAVLRENFPNDNFSVTCDDIFFPEGETLFSCSEEELGNRISYEIALGGIQTADNMNDAVAIYKEALDTAGTDYARIVFKGGSNYWVRRSVTVSKETLIGFYDEGISYVPVATSNSFNRFIQSIGK